MTLKQVLGRARDVLATNSIEDASLEGEILLRQALGIDRVRLYANLNSELSAEQENDFWHLVRRRLSGEPTAYIAGHREFYGLDFLVDRRVLIPRPETELLVEKAVRLARTHNIATVADIGTGCGAIAISLALNLPRIKIYASDVSTDALEVARMNCEKHGVAGRIRLLRGDMLAPLPEPVDLILANLPYVTEQEISTSALAGFEPRLALDGGSDGLDGIRRLCEQATDRLNPQGGMLLEIGWGQGRVVTSLMRRHFPSASLEIIPDLQGMERVISLRLTPG
ncbi:MAG TPA: peptide chain release factor N(5)-glutamine methyltransferase [Dehalococcoidales bacterium]|nr:peptide chain release factor N(5)-glutamine methyltransferase [Dehalococcoidales bacterium]